MVVGQVNGGLPRCLQEGLRGGRELSPRLDRLSQCRAQSHEEQAVDTEQRDHAEDPPQQN